MNVLIYNQQLHTAVKNIFQSAQALWVTILRFMGDLAEPQTEASQNKPVMATISQTLSKRFAKTLSANTAVDAGKARKLIRMTLKRQNKLRDAVQKGKIAFPHFQSQVEKKTP